MLAFESEFSCKFEEFEVINIVFITTVEIIVISTVMQGKINMRVRFGQLSQELEFNFLNSKYFQNCNCWEDKNLRGEYWLYTFGEVSH